MFTLTGTLKDHAGKPVADSAVVIIPSPSMTKDTSGNTVYLGGTTVYTDSTGKFTASLVADSGGGIVYTVRSAYGGPLDQPIHFDAPADGVTIDLADVVPVMVPEDFFPYTTGLPLTADDGQVLTWDASVGEWVARSGTSGTGGTTDHSALTNRDAPDQHPISAITGLQSALDGKQAAGSHESINIDGDTTLPIDRAVLTLRVSAPAVLTVPDAPDGSIITVHVAEGWEHITWAPGITVTGTTVTTETWVVLVRKEGAWSALVSGSGSGGMTGHGRPDGRSWANGEPTWTRGAPIIAPLGTTYTDLDGTDGAIQWMVTDLDYIWWDDPVTGALVEMEDGPVWEVTIGQAWWAAGSQSWDENQLTPPAGYDSISIEATRKGDWVDVQISLVPSGMGQGVPVTVPEVSFYSFGPPEDFSPSQYGDLPIELDGHPDFIAAVGEPPQATLTSIDYLTIPSFEIGAFTAGQGFYAVMNIKAEYRIKEPLSWPIQMEREPDDGGGGGGGGGGVA